VPIIRTHAKPVFDRVDQESVVPVDDDADPDAPAPAPMEFMGADNLRVQALVCDMPKVCASHS
jgi:hypothetical protein